MYVKISTKVARSDDCKFFIRTYFTTSFRLYFTKELILKKGNDASDKKPNIEEVNDGSHKKTLVSTIARRLNCETPYSSYS